MSERDYTAQARGSDGDYARYYAAMDAGMRQKLAFVSAHFLLDPGARIADMGCGSGLGSYQLALINPQIHVIGVDVNPDAIVHAQRTYQLPNLSFVVGDACEPIFASDPLDGILTSSTLHHVYTFNGYSTAAVRKAIASHMACLKPGGMLVIRDFVAPDDPSRIVLLDLPDAPSTDGTPQGLSDAALLLRFARTARPLDVEAGGAGFFLEEIESDRPGWRRFRLPHKWAAEFLLRKDYRTDWETELLEQYTYFTAKDFVATLDALGARVIHAAPYWNPWIIENRFKGKAILTDEHGDVLPWPATNFALATQRVASGTSLRLAEKRPADQAPAYLVRESYRHTGTGQIVDLVRRPSPCYDLVPWAHDAQGRVRVLARHGYPRPIMNAAPRGGTVLDVTYRSGHVVEPIVVAGDARSLAKALAEKAHIAPEDVRGQSEGLTYYPSPGGIDEIVRSAFLELARDPASAAIPAAVSGFSTAGEVRGFDAQDLLRAAQVGMLPEARLELNIYALLARLKIRPEPWIGATPAFGTRAGLAEAALSAELAAREAPFSRSRESAGYLRHLRSVFVDRTVIDERERTLAQQELDFVVPARTSAITVVALPVARNPEGRIMIGLERRDLVPPQLHEGNARTLVAPAFRLDRAPASLDVLAKNVAHRFGASAAALTPLGAPYFPSLGITPERVFPFVLDAAQAKSLDDLVFFPLERLCVHSGRLRDGHLLIALLRLAHALGHPL